MAWPNHNIKGDDGKQLNLSNGAHVNKGDTNSYAQCVNASLNVKKVNFYTLAAPAGNGVDVAISLDLAREVNEHFGNSVYRFFLGKRVAYPVVKNYVKNDWNQYGPVRTMMNSEGIFFFKYSSKSGIEAMLENG